MSVSLRPVTGENVRAVCDLEVAEDQRMLVAPAATTVAECAYEPAAVLRAIYLGEEPVGVLAYLVEDGTPFLVRFMVDAAHQRRGIGRQAVGLLAGELRGEGRTVLETSFVAAANGAGGFWRRCGFEDTGVVREDEQVVRLALGPGGAS